MATIHQEGKNLNVNVNGCTICYDDLGKGSVNIIFIHGFPFDKSSWENQVDFLKKYYRVIAFDIRGFGQSTAGKEEKSISLFADDLVKFMDMLAIKQAVVCGLSMGGYILLNAVERFPERFRAVILCDTQCIADSTETKAKRMQAIQQVQESGLKEYAEEAVKNLFCPQSLETKKEIVEKIKNVIQNTSLTSITGTLKALANREDTCQSLNAISIPTLILCGQEDKVIPVTQSESMHRRINHSIFYIIENAGHLSNMEQPNEFNLSISQFISGLL